MRGAAPSSRSCLHANHLLPLAGQINLWSYTVNNTGYMNFTHERGFDLLAGGGRYYPNGIMVRGRPLPALCGCAAA